MTRYVRLWRELLGLSARRLPVLTAVMAGALMLNTIVPAAAALALRATVDASVRHSVRAAVTGAVGVGLVYCLTIVLGNTIGMMRILLVERIGLTELDSGIIAGIYGIEGLGHLERTDYLDRVTVLRNAAWGVMDSAWGAIQSLSSAAQLGLTLLLLGSVSPWLLLLLAFAAAPLWFDQRGRLGVARAETDSAEEFRLQRHLFEMATSAAAGKEIRVTGSAAALAAQQAAAWDSAIARRARAQVVAALWRTLGWLVFAAGFAGGLGLVVYRAAHGHGTIGDVVLTITVANSLRTAVYATVTRSTETAGYRRLLDPFLWLRSYAERERAHPHATRPAPDRLSSGISLSDLSYTYPGRSRPAVSGVTVRLPAGSVVAIVGEYGSGKTTLVKLLCKFYRPSSGAILIDGDDLGSLDTADWRLRLSAAFQDFGRYHTTFREVVGLGDVASLNGHASADAHRAIMRSVRAADAVELVEGLPDGLSTQLGSELGGIELSEGQWQKTALARACMRPAPVLFVLDEPTASLDAPSEHAIFAHYMARAQAIGREAGAITIIISHRFSTVAGAGLILVMDSGRVIESGSHDSLLALGGRYAELHGIQAAAYAP